MYSVPLKLFFGLFGSWEFQRIFKGIDIPVVLATVAIFGSKDSLVPFQGKIPISICFGGTLKSTATSWFPFLWEVLPRPKISVTYASQKITLTKYIIKDINIYSI